MTPTSSSALSLVVGNQGTNVPGNGTSATSTGSSLLSSLSLSECLENGMAFTQLEFKILAGPAPMTIMTQTVCGNDRWEFNPVTQKCSCIGGYEEQILVQERLGTNCVPCLNGTIRPRWSESPTCLALCLVSNNESAPWLGMSSCDCIAGYERDNTSGLCLLPGDSSPPTWYSELIMAKSSLNNAETGGGSDDNIWIISESSSSLLVILGAILGASALAFATFLLVCV